MKILHTMLRVGDLPRSIDFYTKVLGMQLRRTTDRPVLLLVNREGREIFVTVKPAA